MRIVALVAAKGTSRRVPYKNTRPFANTNLTELKLRQLKQVIGIDEIVLSSESSIVLEIGREVGGITLHQRDPAYSTDNVSMSDVYRHLAKRARGDVIMWVPVTNPLIEAEDYQWAILNYMNFVLRGEHDCLLTVSPIKDYLLYKTGGRPINFVRYPWMKSQHLSSIVKMNFAACMLRREDMIKWGSLVGSQPYLLESASNRFMDIDTMVQFDYCEFLYKQKIGLL